MPIFRTEKEFEDQVCSYIIAKKLNPINSREVIGFVRQPNLGSYGIADIITLEKHGKKNVINIIEMKNTQFQAGMIFQIGRYIEAVKLGIDYKLLNADILNAFSIEEKDPLFIDVDVVGSLVCPESQEIDITSGISSVFNQMKVTLYSADIEMLNVYFSELTGMCGYDPDQIDKIQDSLKQLNYPIDLF